MKRFLAAAFGLALVAGCASSGERSESPMREESVDPGYVAPAAPAPVEISVETGDRDLGAYTVAITFDPTRVRVVSVEPSGEFRPPDYGDRGLIKGELTLSSYQLKPAQPGRTVVARIVFEKLGTESSPLKVRLVSLYDAEGRPIKGSARPSTDRVP